METLPLLNDETVRKAKSIYINFADLTETGAGTAQTFDIAGLLPARSIVDSVALDVPTALEDLSDAAFDDITVQVGDSVDPDATLAITQIAEKNGSTILANNNNTGKSYSAAATFRITVTPKAGKILNNVDQGEFVILVWLKDAAEIGNSLKA